MTSHPASIESPLLTPLSPGSPRTSIETPALLLDSAAARRNIRRMQDAADAAGVSLRPHAKAHKCPALAQQQIAAGAIGICCQKVSEAIPFVRAGVVDIHISNEVVGEQKVRQIAELARHARISVCVDAASQVQGLALAAAAASVRVGVFIEIDVGQRRCGVGDLAAVLALAQQITAHAQLELRGLQAYHGGMQHQRSFALRRQIAADAASRAALIAHGLREAGYPCPTITGGGSGSAEFDLASGVYTEIQPGSYVFMDVDYGSNEYAGELHFEHSLFIATTVMSVAVPGQVVVDAGLKSLSVDSGLPWIWADGRPSRDLVYCAANDEHGIVKAAEPADSEGAHLPALGTQLLMVPGHCDPTFNLYDALVLVQDERIEDVWPVTARGMSW